MSDSLQQLPTDNSRVPHDDIDFVNTVFKDENTKTLNKVFRELRSSVIAGLLFALFSLPQIDKILNSMLPVAEKSPIILLCLKVILFVIILYFINNFAFSKKGI